ncbi:hypothetical protein ACFGVS_00670 [Mucilaginibacter sp. AW1-7]|uniref:hypothetical protein n=1 Tax=Mucilaginibacter sp. AW1-7 TaxID=3349874 RepID=UPI003F73ABC4
MTTEVEQYRLNIDQELKAEQERQANALQHIRTQPVAEAGEDILLALPDISDPDLAEQFKAAALERAKPVSWRSLVLVKIAGLLFERQDIFELVLGILQDREEVLPMRISALNILKQSTFLEVKFNKYLPAYLAALRGLMDDPEPMIRDQVMGVLGKFKDEYLQRRVIEGLEEPGKALVPPERGVQLLGYDIHAEQYPLLQKLLENPPNAQTKIEAARILALDPNSKDLLLDRLKDKGELKDVRSSSALAVQSFAPEEFKSFAANAITDHTEYDDLKSLLLTTITQDPQITASSMGLEFNQQVDILKTRKLSPGLLKAVQNYQDNSDLATQSE